MSTTTRSIFTRAVRAGLIVLILFSPVGGTSMQAAARHSTAQVVYAALGDSLTSGVFADDPHSYPAVLARHLPSGSRFLNLALSGASIDFDRTYELPQA